MNPRRSALKPNEFSKAVARSLRRAGKEARKAECTGRRFTFSKRGKVVAEKP